MNIPTGLEQEIENTVNKAMQVWNIPGLALAVVKDLQVLEDRVREFESSRVRDGSAIVSGPRVPPVGGSRRIPD